MKRFITVCACLFVLCTPVVAQDSYYTKIKRHIAEKIALAQEQRKIEAQQKQDAKLDNWTKALGGDVALAKRFYAQLGEIQHGLDVFYLPQGVRNLVGDDKNEIAYSTDPIVLVVSWKAIYMALRRDCAHMVTIYDLNAQPRYTTRWCHKIFFRDPAQNITYWYDRFQSGISSNAGSFKRNHPYIIDTYGNGSLYLKGRYY